MSCGDEETRKAREVIDAASRLASTRKLSFHARMRRILEESLTPAQLTLVDRIKLRPDRRRPWFVRSM